MNMETERFPVLQVSIYQNTRKLSQTRRRNLYREGCLNCRS